MLSARIGPWVSLRVNLPTANLILVASVSPFCMAEVELFSPAGDPLLYALLVASVHGAAVHFFI